MRAHGLAGEVRVQNESDNPDRFARGSSVYGRASGSDPGERSRCELVVDTVRSVSGGLLVSFRGIEDRTQAEALCGYVLEVPGSLLPPLADDEYYPFEVAGLRVYDDSNRYVGKVEEMLDTPAQPLLTVRLVSGEQVLVPFVREVVLEIDRQGGRAVVSGRFLEDWRRVIAP